MSDCSTEDGHDYVFKLLLIGHSSVGKSCLISRFTSGKLTLDPKPTTTNLIASRHVYVDCNIIEAQIVDIAGNHKYRDFTTDVQMQDVVGALIVYDVTRLSTFEDVERWHTELQIANDEIEVILIGNKSDLVKDSVTAFTKDGKEFAEKVSLTFIETSAKDNKNVEKAFAELVTQILRKVIKNNTIDAVVPASPTSSSQAQMLRSSGKNEPGHYMLKIESFSLLIEAGTNKFKSDVFEASGYKWKLDLYPNGNKKENAGNHISIYLTICDTESFPKGWNVCIDCKFFVYDHIRDNYITFNDVDGKKTRFHGKKKKCGFSKLISLDYFNDAGNGCLFHGSCVFGAEVFAVPKYAEKDQCLSMIKPPAVMNSHTWEIENFSATTEDILYSDYFKAGKVSWKLSVYPKGDITGKANKCLSIFLEVHDSELLPDGWRVNAKCRYRVKNQCGFADKQRESNAWFHKAASSWGYSNFMLLSELGNPDNGYLLDDVLTVEAEILFVGMLKTFSCYKERSSFLPSYCFERDLCTL